MFYYTDNSVKKQSKNVFSLILRAALAFWAAAGLVFAVGAAFFFLLSAGGCAAEELSSLRAFAQAQAGVYRCESASLNGVDLLQRGRIELELCPNGVFCVRVCSAEGKERTAKGTYAFDGEHGVLELRGSMRGVSYCKRCVYEKGAFAVQHTAPGVRFAARFRLLP